MAQVIGQAIDRIDGRAKVTGTAAYAADNRAERMAFGSIVGAVLLTILPQFLSTLEGWETVAFGLVLMTSMIFLPKGVVPTLRARLRRGTA